MPPIMIVESPNKVKKIRHYLKELGRGMDVLASVGHIRDLPKNDLGVDTSTLVPTYVVSESKTAVVAKLKKAIHDASEVYLATDPDREGESISWHLYDALGIKRAGIPVYRVRFNEINKKAIGEAMDKAGKIDMQLVYAQEARRVLDRLVGYLVSPRLGAKLSAGRVQSPALRLIVEREEEIINFKPVTFYDVLARVKDPSRSASALWDHSSYRSKDQEHWLDEAIAQTIAEVTKLKVLSVEQRKRSAKAPPPFTTSSLQQAASVALGFSPEKTMDLAQNLFAQGAISYHRTDSPNLAEESIADIARALRAANFPVVDKPNKWPSKSGAQEAHEAIHPIDYTQVFAGETEDEQKLYELIKSRALACQMPDAIFDTTTVTLEGDVRVPMDGKPALFKMHGEVPTSQRGWMALVAKPQEQENDDLELPILPVFRQGELLDVAGEVLTKKTKPPGRYTEASLVRKLESFEIGRPSTYAAILGNIKGRDYVVVNRKRQLEPTEKGISLIHVLKDAGFSFMEYDWTKAVEQRLDAISIGQDKYKSVVGDLHKILEQELRGLPESERQGLQRVLVDGMECRCGGAIEESDRAYQCQKCRAMVWKVISSRSISQNEAALLFAGDRLPTLDGFISSKSKNAFSAGLVMNEGRVEFYFDDEPRNNASGSDSSDSVIGGCHCGGSIEEGQKHWKCKSCQSTVWKIMSGRTMRQSEALKLFQGESLELDGFASRSGKPFNAIVIIKDGKAGFKFENKV